MTQQFYTHNFLQKLILLIHIVSFGLVILKANNLHYQYVGHLHQVDIFLLILLNNY